VSPRLRPWAVALLLPALLGTVTACATGEDDEMARPTRTVTATPSTTLPPLAPDTVPVGRGAVRPDDVVWAQGSRLHVDDRVFDLSPRRVEQLVVVPGGVFFVEEGRLWFTDLAMVRDTGLTDVTSIATDAQGDGLVVTRGQGEAREVDAWNAVTGQAVPSAEVQPATVADRLGRPAQVVVRGERSDVDPGAPQPARLGPGSFGIVGGDGEPLVAFAQRTRQRVDLDGVAGTGFELVRWTGGATFHGLATADGRAIGVLDCDLDRRECRTAGRVVRGEPVVFESGT